MLDRRHIIVQPSDAVTVSAARALLARWWSRQVTGIKVSLGDRKHPNLVNNSDDPLYSEVLLYDVRDGMRLGGGQWALMHTLYATGRAAWPAHGSH